MVLLKGASLNHSICQANPKLIICLALSQEQCNSLLWARNPKVLVDYPGVKLRGGDFWFPHTFPHHHHLLQQNHSTANGRLEPQRHQPGQQESHSQPEALGAFGQHGDSDLPALLPALSPGPLAAPARCVQPLELQHLAGPAARGGGDPVSGSVEQHGQPAAVLLLYKDVQGKLEGSPLLTAVQQRRVHQIGEHETKEHQLRRLLKWGC